MPRKSETEHVRKICGCARWRECSHPWYVDYQEKGRRYRPNLDILIGRHARDFADAKKEARRAITAWLDGRDPSELQPGDRPTLAAMVEAYGRRQGASATEKVQAGPILRTVVNGRPLGEWRSEDITREMLEAFRRQRPHVAANRDLAMLRAMFNWAVLGGLLPATPFKVGTVAAVKLSREEPRSRRLQAGEEERLRTACTPGRDRRGQKWRGNPDLRDLIVAALETGCRLGELLSLQWAQVRGDLFLPAGKTKAKKPRRVPVSSVLRAVLEARRNDPAGDPLPSDAFVFGDAVGRRRESVKTAWRLACRRAKITDLHFHDLRREAGSRWMDAGVPLSTIQRWLGHHNIAQTSTYLAATGGGDADAMRRFEEATGRLTLIDVFAGPNGSQASTSDKATSEPTNKNAVNRDPTVVVH